MFFCVWWESVLQFCGLIILDTVYCSLIKHWRTNEQKRHCQQNKTSFEISKKQLREMQWRFWNPSYLEQPENVCIIYELFMLFFLVSTHIRVLLFSTKWNNWTMLSLAATSVWCIYIPMLNVKEQIFQRDCIWPEIEHISHSVLSLFQCLALALNFILMRSFSVWSVSENVMWRKRKKTKKKIHYVSIIYKI